MSAEAQLHKNWSTGFTGTYVNSKISKQSSANNGILATVYGAPSSYDLAGIPSHVEGARIHKIHSVAHQVLTGAYWAGR